MIYKQKTTQVATVKQRKKRRHGQKVCHEEPAKKQKSVKVSNLEGKIVEAMLKHIPKNKEVEQLHIQ